ncbi:hypothetical protein NE683_10245 [Bariatricus massiliensis]|uniref:EF-hand domain-containing protein n=1 Tax=Bariatricus massiliensis TaxID=1745713 RepID=A0ABS8DD90_9FIRM|nr:hypothetical protein [Bariatricus massiliensis]MCB7302502.1 hypothetical protein [Bariatricus massiliensis]MCB7373718.1 hypothetical protein [Bariatricus massiliensis]MCB7386388.1 hypothetical protein [Bariatricus massiliensis]MCB7410550.1 hypothetical protein [Bariatricus massiliensis]MCQ5253613.1 hypothetical protein [Bariatricus massiliensis]
MKTLQDIKNYAIETGMNESAIARLISEVESDGNGNITEEDYENIIFGIDCETEGV